ncbi:MAG: hypothetical protein ABI383_04640 [Acidobacteriaceae bacterium]
MTENAQNAHADMIDPTESNNSLSKANTNSDKKPAQNSAGEIGAEDSQSTVDMGELGATKRTEQRPRPKKDAA